MTPPTGLGWWAEFLAALVFGLVGAVIPVANAEAYAAAVGALHPAGGPLSPGGGVAAISGLTLGQSIGKMAMFVGVRRGKDLPFFRPRITKAAERPRGRWRRGWDRGVRATLGLVGNPVWGLPMVLASAVVGFPPLYPLVIAAGASRLSAWGFAATITVGRGLRFALLAWGGTAVVGWLG